MLHPIFGIDLGRIPIYFLMLTAAFFAGLIVLNVTTKRRGFSKFTRRHMRGSYYCSTLVGIAAANAATWFLYGNFGNASFYNLVTEGGFSFYFGLLGFLLSLSLNALVRRYPVKSVVNIFVPVLTIVHFFARMGCMLRGCCYGQSVTILGTTVMFPAREIECAFALIMFIVFMATERVLFFERLSIYLFSYSALRFCTEFFRGDDRGTLFGIEALSPAQIISIVVFAIIAIKWLAQLIIRLGHLEGALDGWRQGLRRKGKAPRVLRTFDCQEPIRKSIALRIILPVLIVGVIVFGLLVYFNPFNLSVFDSIRYDIEDAIYGLFKEGGTEQEIGIMNGGELTYISDPVTVANGAEAVALIKEMGAWAKAEFVTVKEMLLPNNKKAYVMRQTVNGKCVLGSECVLVVTEDGRADYMIGDDSALSHTNEVTGSAVTSSVTISQAFGPNIIEMSRTECYYDTGNGLIDAYHVLLSDDGTKATIGAIVRADNGYIISLTSPNSDTVATQNKLKLDLVTQVAIDALKEIDSKKPLSIADSRLLTSAKKDDRLLATALEEAYRQSRLSPSGFATVLCSVRDSISCVGDVSVQKFSDMVAREVRDAQIAAGISEKNAESCSAKVRRAFTSGGFKATDDENVTHLDAGERRSTFKHKINYQNDEDTYTLDINENHAIDLSVRTDKPVVLEVCNEYGAAVLSAYVEDEEELSLYREDGLSYTLRVKDASLEGAAVGGGFNYKVSVKGISEPEIPKEISDLLTTVEDSYNRSNLTTFLSVAISEGQIVSMEEAIAVGALGAATDSCVSSCAGMGDGVDASKTAIATVIVPNGDQMQDQLSFLKGTEMELEYFDHKTEGNTAYICASLRIMMDGMSIYDGYCYLQAEYITKDDLSEYSSSVGNEELDNLLSFAQGDRYYLVDFNSDHLYSVFGVTNGMPDSQSDLQSLYDLWETRTMSVTSPDDPQCTVEVPYMYIDRERALAAGHSEDKVDGFEEYTARQNLMQAKMQRMMLLNQYAVFSSIAEMTGPITDLIDVITDPLGTGLDLMFGQNEASDTIWNVGKFLYNPIDYVEDMVTDVVIDTVAEEAGNIADQYAPYISAWDEVIKLQTQALNEATMVDAFMIDPRYWLAALRSTVRV